MKHGLIFFAALVAVALVVGPVAWADTKQVDSLSNTTTDAGADIAVDANGNIYVSAKVSASQLQVQKGTNGGTFTDFLPATTVDTNTTAGSVSTQRTAIALYGPADSVIVAIDTALTSAVDTGGGRGIAIYVNDTATSTLRRLLVVDLRGGSGETALPNTQRITAFDLLANDSFVILAVNYGAPNNIAANVAADTLALFVWRVAPNGAALASIPYTRYVLDTDPGFGADLQIAEGPAGGLKVATDTAFRFYVMLNVTYDSEPNAGQGTVEDRDTGISVYRVTLADTASGGPGLWSSKLRFGSSRYGVISAGGGDTFVDAAMVLDQEDAGDTIDRVTIIVSPNSVSKGSDTLIILVIDDDSASIPAANSNFGDSDSRFQWSDTFSQLDTGLANVAQTGGANPASLAFSRSGNSLTLYFITSAGDLLKATASLDRTSQAYDTSFAASISWSVDTLNQALGYVDNDPISIQADLPTVTRFLELSQTVVNGVLYVVGHDRTSGRIWYVASGAAAESKKKDSAVCLMDRLFGKTGLRAAFPALKTFRDTLLGTDLGRKAVSLYYGF